MPDQNSQYETPVILHDAPLRDTDKADFHFDKFAITLARLIATKKTRTPLTIGISGPWGSGKTTLLQRVKELLDRKPFYAEGKLLDDKAFCAAAEKGDFRLCKTVWFEAWKYDDEDELLTALIRVILNTMSEGTLREKFWQEWINPEQPDYDALAMFLNAFKLKFGGVGFGVDLNLDPKKYETESLFKTNAAFYDYFDEALETLLARWVHGKGDYKKINEQDGALVIFIDDLDRCLPKQTVQVLEAIKLFLDKTGCIFLLGADIHRVQAAVGAHYQGTGVTEEDGGASDYLEKVIQLRFELPPIEETKMEDFLSSTKIIDAEWGKNWKILITGADVNPRKVKTFINGLSLQWAMLKNSGQAEGVNRGDFNAWQVLVRAAPSKFVKRVRERYRGQPDVRYNYVMAAIAWANGDEAQAGQFKEYENFENVYRFQRVLQKLTFGEAFTPEVLDSFVCLSAPPDLEPPPSETKQAPRTDDAARLRGMSETKGISPAGVEVIAGLDWVRVPAGEFIMGSKEDDEQATSNEHPQHSVMLPEYRISRTPVTNAQYNHYVQAQGGEHPVSDWQEKEHHPIVNVSWRDAMDYCQWLTAQIQAEAGDGFSARLPSEAEWEKAARGQFGNQYPWGDEWDSGKCNSSESGTGGTTPVGQYSPDGDSPYGAADMAGNVWEWMHSLFKEYPYDPTDGREDEEDSGLRVLRGGAFNLSRGYVRCASRNYGYLPNDRGLRYGFRVVLLPISAL